VNWCERCLEAIHAKSKGVKRASTRGTRSLKEKKPVEEQRPAAGIKIDFGRLPLLKGEDRDTPRTDKSRRSDPTRIRVRCPLEAMTPHSDTSKKKFQPTVAPEIPGAFINSHPKREESSTSPFCSRRRRDVAPHCADREPCRPPRAQTDDAASLARYALQNFRWTCQLFHCVVRYT